MRAISNFFVKIINRWLPDPFLFAIILTLVAVSYTHLTLPTT